MVSDKHRDKLIEAIKSIDDQTILMKFTGFLR